MHFLALAAALAKPSDHVVAGALRVGHDAKQFMAAVLAERLGGKRQFRLVAESSWRSGSRIARNSAHSGSFACGLPSTHRISGFHRPSRVAITAVRKASV